MSSLSNMYMEEAHSSKKDDAFYVKKRKLYIGLVVLAVVFLAIIIIVYYSAKPSKDELNKNCPTQAQPAYSTAVMPQITPLPTPAPFDTNKECGAAVCVNPYKALGKKTLRFVF